MKTALGLLTLAVIGGFITIVLSNGAQRVARWSVANFSPHFRSRSRKSTENEILYLTRIYGDTYQLLMAILWEIAASCFACAYTAPFFLITITLVAHLPTSAYSKLPHTPSTELDAFSFAIVAAIVSSVISTGWVLGNLYKKQNNFDETIAALESRLADLDAKEIA